MSGPDRTSLGLAERGAERVARVYATLSMAYEAIVRIRERLALFEAVCRVLVEHGQLRMAWVGVVDDHGWIVPVAHAGVVDGYLDELGISVLDVPEGRGPTGTAARDRRHMFVADIATDERMRPWREAALARGYRSSAAFPLVVDDRCAAVLTAYASEPAFFDEAEVELFDRMAADLSFGLEAMQREERRRALEAELRSSEERFRVAAESMLDGFAILSPIRDAHGEITDFRYRYVNDAYCGLVDFDQGRLVGRRVGELFPQFLGGERFELYRRVALTGDICRTDEVQLPSTWAGTALASRVFDTVIASMGEDIVVSVRNVTDRKQAEQERERALAELLEAQQIAELGSWYWDPATGARTWSAGMYQVYGRDPAGGPIGTEESFAWVHPDDLERVQDAYARMVEHSDRFELDYRLRTGDRGMRTVHAIARPDPDRPGGYRGTLQDVTALREAEKALRLRAELLDLAHDAVLVRDPVDSRVTFWNREAESIYGYTRAEAADRVTHELLSTVFPETEEVVEEALAREGRWVGELVHTRKDGEVIVVASRQALQRGEDGRPLAIIAVNSDITERKRAEQQLAETAGRLERTAQTSKTGGWEYDLATGKLTWTDEVYRIYGGERTSEPVELERALAAFDPDSAPILRAALERLLADGEPCDLEVVLVRADRKRIWVRVVGQAVIEGGRVVRVHGIIADITDRKLVEEKLRTLNAELEQRVAARTADLERANKELESFAYSVSHDLRAPLRAVDGFSKALLDDYAQKIDEDGRHCLERVRAAAVRMGNLIDDILQLSRLSRQQFERVPLNLSALAREVIADLDDAEPDRRVKVEIEDALHAEADLGLVQSVLQNLLANAYKFTSKTTRPAVRFGAVDQNGVPVYFVADNGAGFDMAHADELFRPFHRLHRESEFPGDGIGLATAARAVHRHGGVIWAQGAVGRGATFNFSLTPGAHPPASAATGKDLVPAWQQTDGDERR